MRACAELASIKIPPHIFHWYVQFFDSCLEFVVALLAFRATSYLTYLREQHIHGTHCAVIVVHLHVERLYLLGIIGYDNRTFIVLFYQIALMFSREVATPINREFKLVAVFYSFFENLYAFGIFHTGKIILDNELEAFYQSFVNHFVEEFYIVCTVLQCPAHAIFYEILGKVHVVVYIIESDFGLYHPKLRQVAWRVRVFGAERWSKSIYSAQCRSAEFSLQLSRNSKRSRFSIKVV